MGSDFTLYSLADAHARAVEGGYTVDYETGEVIWEPSQLDELGLALADKAEATCAYRRKLNAMIDAMKDEKAKLDARIKIAEKAADRLDEYMVNCVRANDGKAIETPKCRISTRKAAHVEIIDEEAVPRSFIRQKVTESYDKAEIARKLKAGTDVPGCVLVTETHVSIK